MFNKREYDRLRIAKTYALFKRRRKAIITALGKVCFICRRHHPQMHLHHVKYTAESNYPRNSKSFWTRLKRLAEAERHPGRFCLLCPLHHLAIEHIKALPKVARRRLLALSKGR